MFIYNWAQIIHLILRGLRFRAELKEKEDAARVARQRPVLRVCAELALVGIVRDGPAGAGASG